MDTISVVMTKTARGAEDGITVKQYAEGQTYDMESSLAQAFIKSKRARPAPQPDPKQQGDDKGTGGDSTKGGKGPDENK